MQVGDRPTPDHGEHVAGEEDGLDEALAGIGPAELGAHWDYGDGEVDAVETADDEGEETEERGGQGCGGELRRRRGERRRRRGKR